jgi:hypothetical protein
MNRSVWLSIPIRRFSIKILFDIIRAIRGNTFVLPRISRIARIIILFDYLGFTKLSHFVQFTSSKFDKNLYFSWRNLLSLINQFLAISKSLSVNMDRLFDKKSLLD